MARQLFGVVLILLISAAPCSAAEASSSTSSRINVNLSALTIALVGECGASETALSLARRESARVWSRADVSLNWVRPSELPFAAPRSGWLVVQCVSARRESATADEQYIKPIAAIRFINSEPTNLITLSPENALALLEQQPREARDRAAQFIPFRDIRLGRMLGRAIAHEVGHFLTRSGDHTRSGLMRATHSVPDLTGAGLGPFAVKIDRPVLQARRLTMADCGEPPATSVPY